MCFKYIEDRITDIQIKSNKYCAAHGAAVVVCLILGVYLQGEIRKARQEKLTFVLHLVLFMILLLCGDVESNPGPETGEVRIRIDSHCIF